MKPTMNDMRYPEMPEKSCLVTSRHMDETGVKRSSGLKAVSNGIMQRHFVVKTERKDQDKKKHSEHVSKVINFVEISYSIVNVCHSPNIFEPVGIYSIL